ncbi:flagellar biosynthesis protein FlgJ [Methylobacterium sp. Leaf456]|uniref:rod-binding protein n=1 Tax=Methylobacterium sp. Leaf456 TaxID=1736382 RepID=UPI0006FB15B1|nr:rod-binding protein [Methylobacterium sp. Leaf456]KQT56963.1 flagellar biosynthesis protein FlgJ [Methylobacterium sp. Leaf456]
MSITPPSDIVMDVARAADPARYQEAAAKLSQPGDPAAFAAATAEAARDAGYGLHMPIDARGALTSLKNDTSLKGSADPYRKFEGQVLAQFIETMLPDKSEAVYGKGNTGNLWKSMLAEQVGQQIAKSGGIGIAKMLEKAQPNTVPNLPAAATGVAGKV